jgi:hypothetical protein
MKNADKMSKRELRVEIKELRVLLEAAACPNEGCGGQGWSSHQVADGVWEQEQCQWCYEKKLVVDEHG